MPASPFSPPVPRARWPEALVWAGVAACVAGFFAHRLWQSLPAARFGESLLLAGLAGLIAWPLRRWRGWAWADALALVWLLALLVLTGIVPAVAVIAIACAAAGLGSALVGATRPLLALLAGLAMLAAVVGWTLPLPVHRWWVYAPLLGLAIVARRDALRAQAAILTGGWRQAVDASPQAAAWTTLLLGLAAAGAWLPTMQHDDLAYHLGLPWQLLLHGRYALDPSHQVWALAPWAGDVLQAIAQVLARAEARSAFNALWFVATAAGLWQLAAALGLRPAMRWATLAVYASLPLVAALLGGMQTETPATAVTVALAALVFDERAGDKRVLDDDPRRRRILIAAALLFGLLCALKQLHGLTALPLLAWAAWRGRSRIDSLGLLLALAGALAVAASSYTYAWLVAGNPVLPLLNDVFASPYFAAANFNDSRWQSGLGADTPWRLTFDTARYLEGWSGGIGFVLVALGGAWALAFADARTRALAVCATLAMGLALLPLQYARYLHPGMVLLLPALLAAIDRRIDARRAAWLVAGLCVLNLAFQANAQWFLHTGGIKRSVAALGGDMPLFARYVPERLLAAAIRERAPGSGRVLVLDPAMPYYAELAGRGRSTAWYDPKLEAARTAADADASGAAWSALLQRERIAEVIVRPASLTPAQRAGLQRVGARRDLVVDEAQWWRIPTREAAP
ncbi:hypothetical protein ACFQZQ_12580 [Lysobacter koreensis]|uniref:Glycosyltransferase RgtA/B/C/D-like domain-containing protein n=1 Tax=Lysobacter koreensis TaxID=266122 RepID=A0ABW2YQE2_9GAMM